MYAVLFFLQLIAVLSQTDFTLMPTGLYFTANRQQTDGFGLIGISSASRCTNVALKLVADSERSQTQPVHVFEIVTSQVMKSHVPWTSLQ